MSHFTVLVIGDNPEEQLAPFNERLEVEFDDQSEDAKKEYETETRSEFYSNNMTVLKEEYETLKKLKIGSSITFLKNKLDPFEYFKKGQTYQVFHRDEFDDEYIYVKVTSVLDSDHPDPDVCFEGRVVLNRIDPPKKIPLKEFYPDYNTFLEDWLGYDNPDKIGYWRNPQAKWDWYQLGGRWSGFFKLKPQAKGSLGQRSWTNENEPIVRGTADQALNKDIDWDGMEDEKFEELCAAYDEFKEKWDKGEFKDDMISVYFDYGVENTSGNREEFIPETREQYLRRRGGLQIFAFVKDGKWYEKGDMGWWGIVSDEKDPQEWRTDVKKMITELPDDTLMSLFDCHI